MKKGFLILALVTTTLCSAQFDGWTNGKGTAVVALSAGAEFGQDYKAGPELVGLKRTIVSSSLFASYGIAKHLDIGLALPFVSIEGTSGLQDGSAYLKYMFHNSEKSNFGVILGGAAPLSDYLTDNGLATIGQQAQVLSGAVLGQWTLGSGHFVGAAFQYNSKSDPVPSDVLATAWLARAGKIFFSQYSIEYRHAIDGKDYRGVGDLMPSTFQEIGATSVKATGKIYRQFSDRAGYALAGSLQMPLRNADLSYGIFASFVMKFAK